MSDTETGEAVETVDARFATNNIRGDANYSNDQLRVLAGEALREYGVPFLRIKVHSSRVNIALSGAHDGEDTLEDLVDALNHAGVFRTPKSPQDEPDNSLVVEGSEFIQIKDQFGVVTETRFTLVRNKNTKVLGSEAELDEKKLGTKDPEEPIVTTKKSNEKPAKAASKKKASSKDETDQTGDEKDENA